MAVYILHFHKAHHHAQHYVGAVNGPCVESRIARHKAGNGAKIVARFAELGIGFEVAQVWPEGDFKMEKAIKHRHGSIKQFCPVCRAMED